MTLPTTQKECTTRRIAVLISGLWTKIKNGFVQFSSVGAASGVASLDSNGKVPSSQMPEGIYSPADVAKAITAQLGKGRSKDA